MHRVSISHDNLFLTRYERTIFHLIEQVDYNVADTKNTAFLSTVDPEDALAVMYVIENINFTLLSPSPCESDTKKTGEHVLVAFYLISWHHVPCPAS